MLQQLKKYFKTPKGFGQLVNTMALIAPARAGKLAFDIFCTPRKGRAFTPNQIKLLSKAKQERLPLQEFELQTYMWEGGAEKVLLVHGWDSNAARWKPVIKTLQDANYTVVAFDAPAHGKSGREKINAGLYAEAVEKVMHHFKPSYVVGHSFGGIAVAHYFANFEALSVKRIILMATPSKLSRMLADYYQLIRLRQRCQRALAKYFNRTFGFNAEYFSIEDFIQKVKIKGLVIHDEEDVITPFQEGKAIHEGWKNSELFTVKGVGHSLQNRAVYYKILDFIQNG